MLFSSFSDMKATNTEYDDRKAVVPRLHHHHHLDHLNHHHQKPECISEEVDSRSSSGEMKKQKKDLAEYIPAAATGGGSGGDGASIEVVRRPRGRPPGSKNKPKPPVIITRDAEPSSAMRPHVLEIAAGHDVVDSLAAFSRRRNLGICVLAGTGSVANVTLRQPTPGPTVTFHGRFEILSISATFFPSSLAGIAPSFSISLAGPQGQIVGGTVAGAVVAAATVVVVAATFSNPTYHRLPVEDEVSVSVSGGGGGGGDVDGGHDNRHEHEQPRHHHQQQNHQHHQHHQHHQQHHGGSVSAAATVAAGESCGMSIYSSHLPSDVIWAPTARPPPPY